MILIMKLKSQNLVYTDGKTFVVEYLEDDEDAEFQISGWSREPTDEEAQEILDFLKRRKENAKE